MEKTTIHIFTFIIMLSSSIATHSSDERDHDRTFTLSPLVNVTDEEKIASLWNSIEIVEIPIGTLFYHTIPDKRCFGAPWIMTPSHPFVLHSNNTAQEVEQDLRVYHQSKKCSLVEHKRTEPRI